MLQKLLTPPVENSLVTAYVRLKEAAFKLITKEEFGNELTSLPKEISIQDRERILKRIDEKTADLIKTFTAELFQ